MVMPEGLIFLRINIIKVLNKKSGSENKKGNKCVILHCGRCVNLHKKLGDNIDDFIITYLKEIY